RAGPGAAEGGEPPALVLDVGRAARSLVPRLGRAASARTVAELREDEAAGATALAAPRLELAADAAPAGIEGRVVIRRADGAQLEVAGHALLVDELEQARVAVVVPVGRVEEL